ncbi:hypothetical protein [Mycoplasma tauri]|nr:hypothetical protein [Mycoplasma tauri]MBZ4203396.1 hypothetical protein [Mycoplasma tauri]MBZ4204465.1 hypothetical protein [Mycoplasma tauri]MBZ4226751.1 hypothetical protein [Mycoplasma tauri]QSB07368.1 hypothetical protein JS510_02545 [Mycoplasma tauri]
MKQSKINRKVLKDHIKQLNFEISDHREKIKIKKWQITEIKKILLKV